jgi:hypothetical protein
MAEILTQNESKVNNNNRKRKDWQILEKGHLPTIGKTVLKPRPVSSRPVTPNMTVKNPTRRNQQSLTKLICHYFFKCKYPSKSSRSVHL